MRTPKRFEKHPNEARSYFIDWQRELRARTIISAHASIDGGDGQLEVDLVTVQDAVVRVRLTGGTAGHTYNIEQAVTLSDGDTLVEEFLVYILDIKVN